MYKLDETKILKNLFLYFYVSENNFVTSIMGMKGRLLQFSWGRQAVLCDQLYAIYLWELQHSNFTGIFHFGFSGSMMLPVTSVVLFYSSGLVSKTNLLCWLFLQISEQ